MWGPPLTENSHGRLAEGAIWKKEGNGPPGSTHSSLIRPRSYTQQFKKLEENIEFTWEDLMLEDLEFQAVAMVGNLCWEQGI